MGRLKKIEDINNNIDEYVICSHCFAVNNDKHEECWDCSNLLKDAIASRDESDINRTVMISKIVEQISSWLLETPDEVSDDDAWEQLVEV